MNVPKITPRNIIAILCALSAIVALFINVSYTVLLFIVALFMIEEE